MPIRRPRTPRPALRHVSFLETMASSPVDDPRYLAAQGAFLALRLLDHRIAFGARLTAPASQALEATRASVAQLAVDDELRGLLDAVTDAVVAMDSTDPQPVLPLLFSLAELLDARGQAAEAGDVFLTIAHRTDAAWHPDLAYASFMRAGACLRRADDPDWADRAFAQAAQLAHRDRDTLRTIEAKLGRAQVTWLRGDLRAADAAIATLLEEAEAAQSTAMTSRLLHERATLAWVRGELELAVRWAFRAFDLAPNARERDAILTALAAYLDGLEAPDAAQVARGAIEINRLARSRPVPRTAEADRATALELAREVARALRARALEMEPE